MARAEIRKHTMTMSDWLSINQILQGVSALTVIYNKKRWVLKVLVK